MKVLSHLLLFLLLGTSCDKSDDKPPERTLPPVSAIGANTFGCRIDGKVWIPGGFAMGAKQLETYYFSEDSTSALYITALNLYTKERVSIYFTHIFSEGTFLLVTPLCNVCDGISYNPDTGSNMNIFYINKGRLNISRLDTVNKIAAGTFEGEAYNDAGQRLEIADGRFDVKF